MKYCPKCRYNLDDDANFCIKCGTSVKVIETCDEDIENYEREKFLRKCKRKRFLNIFSVIIALIFAAGTLVYYVTFISHSKSLEKSINIKSIDCSEYPKINLILEVSNIREDICSDNITIKEGKMYPKEISIEKLAIENEYKITYLSSTCNLNKSLEVLLEYSNENIDLKCKSKYKSPKLPVNNKWEQLKD